MFIGGGYFSAGYTSMGSDPYGNYKQGQDTGQLTVTLTKQLGTQELKFGFDGGCTSRTTSRPTLPTAPSASTRKVLAMPEAVANCGGDAMATFLMGYPNAGGYYEIQEQPAIGKLSLLPAMSRTTGERPTN